MVIPTMAATTDSCAHQAAIDDKHYDTLAEALAEAEILSRRTVFSEDETGITLYTEVYCITDIAEEVKIKTD